MLLSSAVNNYTHADKLLRVPRDKSTRDEGRPEPSIVFYHADDIGSHAEDNLSHLRGALTFPQLLALGMKRAAKTCGENRPQGSENGRRNPTVFLSTMLRFRDSFANESTSSPFTVPLYLAFPFSKIISKVTSYCVIIFA